MKPTYHLGVNHHLLYPESMVDPAYHLATLPEVLSWPEFEVIDAMCTGDRAQREEEACLLRMSGKTVVYNSPLYANIPWCDPNSLDPTVMLKTHETARQHLDAAAMCGASLINIASGTNPPRDMRQEAWHGWMNFLCWYGIEAGKRGMRVIIEPFDQSIGKNLLIGPTRDAVDSVKSARERGIDNVGLMVDMGHLPIMGETFAHAVQLSAPYLWHVHLGSAVIRDADHAWYGDCHPPFDIPAGEHGVSHLAAFLGELVTAGYFEQPEPTLTFEMRPYAGISQRESVDRWLAMLEQAWQLVEEEKQKCVS
ncbi:MAG TPA: TIM barrel protein [Armatimonadota bacterium]|nr:TIM barrel protein [Armatimonadota bacterium]